MKGIDTNAIKSALAESTLLVDGSNEDHPITEIGEQWDDIYRLSNIEEVVKRIGKSAYTLFRLKRDEVNGGWSLKTTVTGKKLVLCLCRYDLDRIRQEYPWHEFNPYIKEFFLMRDSFRYREEVLEFAHLSDQKAAFVVDALNAFCRAMQEAVRSDEFVGQLHNRQRAANKNYLGLVKYIDRHLHLRRRLLVLRVDLGIAKDLSSELAGGQPVDWATLKLYLKKLIRTLSEHVLADVWRGYAYKIEYGLQKGLHIHLMVLLNGDLARQDVTIARMIGELWKGKITGGRGTYFNCNAIKHSYRGCGIGMILANDGAARKYLYYAAMYLTKTDYYVNLVMSGGGKAFGKGKMPELSEKRLGRPRKAPETLATISKKGSKHVFVASGTLPEVAEGDQV